MMGLQALVMMLGLASGGQGDPPGSDTASAKAPVERKEAGPRKPQDQDSKPQERPFQEPERLPARLEEEGLPWIDFEWLELQPRVGMAIFSEDYRISPTPYVSVLAHVPLPLLSLGANPGGEHFGLFAEIDVVPSVKRDLNPAPDHSSGTIFFMSMGVDYTVLRDQTFYLVVQAGVQYGFYGGIADLSDGIAPVAGLTGGFYLGKGLTLTLGSELVLGDSSNRVLLNSLGLVIEF